MPDFNPEERLKEAFAFGEDWNTPLAFPLLPILLFFPLSGGGCRYAGGFAGKTGSLARGEPRLALDPWLWL